MSTKDNYVESVFTLLNSNPTQAELDSLVEAHVRIGYLAAQAEHVYEQAVDQRKYEEANAWLAAKRSAEKVTAGEASVMAEVAIREFRISETEAKVKAQKVKNLLESIEQAINAIKFLGRFDSSAISVPR